MKIRFPQYYEMFHCIAAACPDSCCKEWEVDVDDTAAVYYRSLEGDLGNRLREVLKDTEDGTVMTIENGRCPMWRQDGLCRIQAELGHEALCQVCREFPRLRHDYGDFVEYGLELSCPEAARLIFSQSHDWLIKDVTGVEEPEYDEEAMQILLESRDTIFDFLKTTSLAPNLALTVVLLYAHEVQSWIDGDIPAILDVNAYLQIAEKHATQGNWELLVSFFKGLEILTPQWQMRLDHPAAPTNWEPSFLAFLRYLIGRYWLQAVSDYDLISRVKFMITACLLVHHLGGNLQETAQLFSKEIENDPDNLETILDGAYSSPALTDVHLLSLLLNS